MTASSNINSSKKSPFHEEFQHPIIEEEDAI